MADTTPLHRHCSSMSERTSLLCGELLALGQPEGGGGAGSAGATCTGAARWFIDSMAAFAPNSRPSRAWGSSPSRSWGGAAVDLDSEETSAARRCRTRGHD